MNLKVLLFLLECGAPLLALETGAALRLQWWRVTLQRIPFFYVFDLQGPLKGGTESTLTLLWSRSPYLVLYPFVALASSIGDSLFFYTPLLN